jgi:hypothetical protein
MYSFYKVKYKEKCYKVRAECEDAAIAKLKVYLENKDSIFESDIQDGVGDLAGILGGIALNILEQKKMLQTSRNPSVLESSLKTLGVIGADLIGIGSEITSISKRNSDITNRR